MIRHNEVHVHECQNVSQISGVCFILAPLIPNEKWAERNVSVDFKVPVVTLLLHLSVISASK